MLREEADEDLPLDRDADTEGETGIEEEAEENWDGLLQEEPPAHRVRGRKRSAPHGGKADYEELNARNLEVGQAGERLVIQLEHTRLAEQGRVDPVEKVVQVSLSNDAAGYDIQSFSATGKPIYIEVKATTGGEHTAFYLSGRELAFSRRHKKSFRLYRLFDYQSEPERARFYIVEGDLSDQCELEPTEYRAHYKGHG